LYRSLGFVPKSERKSGQRRKSGDAGPSEPPNTDAA
jgi:hypothetical protein